MTSSMCYSVALNRRVPKKKIIIPEHLKMEGKCWSWSKIEHAKQNNLCLFSLVNISASLPIGMLASVKLPTLGFSHTLLTQDVHWGVAVANIYNILCWLLSLKLCKKYFWKYFPKSDYQRSIPKMQYYQKQIERRKSVTLSRIRWKAQQTHVHKTSSLNSWF